MAILLFVHRCTHHLVDSVCSVALKCYVTLLLYTSLFTTSSRFFHVFGVFIVIISRYAFVINANMRVVVKI